MVASASATAATDFVRALGPSERWFWIIDRISPANCVARVRVHGRLAAGELAGAAAALVAEYPLLRVGVRDAGHGDPRLFPLAEPEIPVRQVEVEGGGATASPTDTARSVTVRAGLVATGVMRRAGTRVDTGAVSDAGFAARSRAGGEPSDTVWRREVDVELATSFVTDRGLARIVDIVHGAGSADEYHDVVLVVSHVIMDGRSLLTLLRKLIRYTEADRGGRVGRVATPVADDLIPVGSRGFWRYCYTTLSDQVAAVALRPRKLVAPVAVGMGERRTRAVYRTIDAAGLAALTADCRRAGVTVHGVLAAAVARVVGETVRPGAKGVAGIGSPVDFRELLEPAPDAEELGIYAPVLAHFVRFGPGESLWAAARAVNRQLERGIRRRKHLSVVAGMRFGTPRTVATGRRVVEMVDRRAPWNVSVTNVGRADFPERVGDRRISDVTLAGSNSCVSALTVSIISTHGHMRLGFCYVTGILDAASAEAFADRVVAELTGRAAPV
ncbi:phthiocerol/phthiodiolone dimycocerosyl transferase family protein [Nocardia sp. NPDC055321]